ncbi:Lem3/Cdc50 [Neoconidiobolus thromboides FSU 785]|nr:Lem3/Cdc50 [Neoconidiobolus thromboides FSU 785]
MSEPERKSRKPPNTAFKQQRLRSWQPILTPKAVLPTLFVLGAIFAPLGGLFLSLSEQVSEIYIDYTDCAAAGESPIPIPTEYYKFSIPSSEEKQIPIPTYKSNVVSLPNNPNNITAPKCTISFNVHTNINPPVYLYYELSNFYQNHRFYVKSLSYQQLKGDFKLNDSPQTDDALEASCKPLAYPNKDDRSVMYYPCGLIANSVFNDTFTNITGKGTDNKSYGFTEKGISLEADKNLFFKKRDYSYDSIVPPPFWADSYPNGKYTKEYPPPNLEEDEHLQVWFRTAGLPRFRKLYGKNNDDVLQAGTYEIEIYMKYNITDYGGRKAIVMSTVGRFGGRNPSLGIAYITMGAICVIAGIIFTARHIYKPRKLGDHTYLSWTQTQSSRAR